MTEAEIDASRLLPTAEGVTDDARAAQRQQRIEAEVDRQLAELRDLVCSIVLDNRSSEQIRAAVDDIFAKRGAELREKIRANISKP